MHILYYMTHAHTDGKSERALEEKLHRVRWWWDVSVSWHCDCTNYEVKSDLFRLDKKIHTHYATFSMTARRVCTQSKICADPNHVSHIIQFLTSLGPSEIFGQKNKWESRKADFSILYFQRATRSKVLGMERCDFFHFFFAADAFGFVFSSRFNKFLATQLFLI